MKHALILALVLCCGCWYHRIDVPSPVTKATEYESSTYWSFFWGSVQKEDPVKNCNGQPLAEVRVSSNLGFALLTVATLGLVAPETVAWRCAKAQPAEGTIGP